MPPPSLADRLAEAQRAEVRPRNRVAELQAGFDAALGERRYTDADRLQAGLGAAREALAVAEGTTRGLREGLAAVEAQRVAEQRAIADAQRHDEAQRVIADAMQAEKRALDGIQESVAQMYACLGAAQDAYRQAQAWEGTAGRERQRVIDARVALGELQYPAPRAVAPNSASALADVDPAVRAVAQWRGR